MPIILARIDERLIHGQIMSSTALSSLKVNQIIVVDPLVKGNSLMQNILTSSAQSGDCPIEAVIFLNAFDLSPFLEENDSPKKRFLAIFKDIENARVAIRDGVNLPSLNLGNYTSKDPLKKFLTDAFSVGQDESLALQELYQKVGKLYFDGLNSRSRPYSPQKHTWE
jgi:PTS system mannose-specific IIB component